FRPLLPAGPVAVGELWPVPVADVLPFLHQLHPGATAELHHDGGLGIGAAGGWACLSAADDHHAEITLRVHADFLLSGDGEPAESVWFTPGQFRGRLVVDRQRRTIIGFELAVPDQSANVDVNVGEKGGVLADIGRVPEMAVRGGRFPELAGAAARLDTAIVQQRLAERFYPFAAIDWLELPAALAASRATGKPMHVVLLFGSLLDESC